MPTAAEKVRLGGWIVSLYNAIREFNLDDTSFDDYETLILAARAAELLSSIRSLGRLTGEKFDTYRRLSSLKPKSAIHVLLGLQKLGALEIEWSNDKSPSIVNVEAKVTTKAEVLAAAASLFSQENTSEKAQCLLNILDNTVDLPIKESDLKNRFTKTAQNDIKVSSAIADLVALGMLSKTRERENGDFLIHNPHTFKSGAVDIYKLLSGFNEIDRSAAMALLEHVKCRPGVPFPARSDQRIINMLVKVGVIDVSGVQLAAKKSAGQFPTAPDAWGVFSGAKALPTSSDLMDDAKLLLNSLRYGEFYSDSGRGRINSPEVLLSRLIERGQVGAATAIGEDYLRLPSTHTRQGQSVRCFWPRPP
jgi:hypothetical protein